MEVQKRNTFQKQVTLEAVRTLCSHATPDEVYEYVKKKYPYISKATVYRNLKDAAEIGNIMKVATPNGADHYDHNTFPHYHIRCEECGRVFDVDMPYMEHLENDIKDKHGFKVSGYNLVFTGICPECQKKKIKTEG